MTKAQLILALETLPDETELYLVHPVIQGAAVELKHVNRAVAGINAHVPRPQVGVLWFQARYPAVENPRPIAYLDWIPAQLRNYPPFSP